MDKGGRWKFPYGAGWRRISHIITLVDQIVASSHLQNTNHFPVYVVQRTMAVGCCCELVDLAAQWQYWQLAAVMFHLFCFIIPTPPTLFCILPQLSQSSDTIFFTMPLVVRRIEHADVSQCIAIRVASLGSLVIGRPPAYPGYVEGAEASVHNDLDNQAFVHHLKVIDPQNEQEVVAYGKWEGYPDGRRDLDELRKPMAQADKEVDQHGLLREAAHDYFCSRNGEMGKQPHLRK